MTCHKLPRLIFWVLAVPLGLGFLVGTFRSSKAQNSPRLAAEREARPPIGIAVPETDSLRDLRGNRRALADFKDRRAVVVAFLGTECPVANLYVPRLVELEKKLRPRGTLFLAVYPNEYETLDQIAAHAYERDIPFPVLKDVGQGLADALGARRTPEFCVLDQDLFLRYRGRLDDQFGVGARRPKPGQEDLSAALEAVLDGKPVARAETPADGCLISRAKPHSRGGESGRPGITYHEHVEPILQDRCQACHRPGRSAPFSLVSAADVLERADAIREVVVERRMPPWHADERYQRFRNDRRLSATEVETIARWVDEGRPLGPEVAARKEPIWHEGWNIGKPDLVIEMPFEFEIPATGVLPYRMAVVPTNFTEDRWVRMAEAMPGDPSVVHHIIVYMISPERLDPVNSDDDMSVLVAWAPGDMPLAAPPGTALRVPKGAELIFELHYTPNGKPARDRSRVGIVFADAPPERELHTNMFAKESLRIPPRDPHARQERSFTFPQDARLLSLIPHMHWRGKCYHYAAVFPDGREEVLLSVPRWDFNWQTAYWFQEPIHLPKGTTVRSVAHWDNSSNNPSNPDPDREVTWGLQSWDEMMVGWMTYVWETPLGSAASAPPKPGGLNPAALLFKLMDRNRNGLVEPPELPPSASGRLAEIGLHPEQPLPPSAFALIYQMIRGGGEGATGGGDGGLDGQRPTEPAATVPAKRD